MLLCVLGKELENKHFVSNPGMELLRRDKGPSLGHMVSYYSSEEHFSALRHLPESVRKGEPAFILEHGMTHYEYMNDIKDCPYEASKMFKGSSMHPIGSDERRKELAEVYLDGMAHTTTISTPENIIGVKNIFEAFPWSTCNTVADVGGSTGIFLASILKRPGCEHIQGYVIELPNMVDKALGNLSTLGVSPDRITFIKQDMLKPLPINDVQADTVVVKSVVFSLKDEQEHITFLKNCRCLFKTPSEGRLLVINQCTPNAGDTEHNTGDDGQQIGFLNVHMLSITCNSYKTVQDASDVLKDMANKAGFELNRTYDTFVGGYTIFELVPQ